MFARFDTEVFVPQQVLPAGWGSENGTVTARPSLASGGALNGLEATLESDLPVNYEAEHLRGRG